MGNRAVITVEGSKVGVYLHWNGGEESVTAFLRAAKDLSVRGPVDDRSYFYARLTQIIGNFLGGTTSVGIDALENLDTDNGDNGTYIVGPNFEILNVKYQPRAVLSEALKKRSEDIYMACMDKNRAIFAKE